MFACASVAKIVPDKVKTVSYIFFLAHNLL